MDKLDETIYSLTEAERAVLHAFQDKNVDILDYIQLRELTGLSDAEISRASLWLENKGIAKRIAESTDIYVITKKGENYIDKNLPETVIFSALKDKKILNFDELRKLGLDVKEINASIGLLIRSGVAKIEKKDGKKIVVITDKGKKIDVLDSEKIFDMFRRNKAIEHKLVPKDVKLLISRGLVKKEKQTIWRLKLTDLGKKLISRGIPAIEFIEQLTPQIITSGQWKTKFIRWYDVEAWVPKTWGGRKNPLRFLMEKIRRIFMDMGFREMRSHWVDLEFWCFDSMWIPQDHPAREMQSTFWLENPSRGFIRDEELKNMVKEIQETGGDTGSRGWRLPWSEEIAKRCILRTHTTATSFRVLGYAIKKGLVKPPVKFFAIGRVFRNETIDWKHLAEFHQIEGFAIAPNLTLRSLMGYIKEFYSRMGIKKIRFKPTYNPYTEPSMEIFAWHKKMKKWVEVGNSGMFRPESLAPYGVKWPTIAWGLALERLAMLLWNIEDIRKVLGPSVELDWIRNYGFPKVEF